MTVALQMANGGDFVKAMVALNQFKATSARDAKRPLSYASVRALQVRLRAPGSGPVSIDLPRAAAPEPAAAQAPARRPGGGAKDTFDLSTFYANEGALADSDNNLIPDRVDVLLSAEGDGSEGVVDLAARLGLESTGISLPIARTAKSLTAPATEPMLVLIGTAHPIVDQLIKARKWEAPPLQPGEGLIQLVKKAFGEKSALIVTGGDAAGVRRAVSAARRDLSPHLAARQGPHHARRCGRGCAEVRRGTIAGRAGGDEPLQTGQARRPAERQGSRVGARQGLRREGG